MLSNKHSHHYYHKICLSMLVIIGNLQADYRSCLEFLNYLKNIILILNFQDSSRVRYDNLLLTKERNEEKMIEYFEKLLLLHIYLVFCNKIFSFCLKIDTNWPLRSTHVMSDKILHSSNRLDSI